jgi:hypothetical protein
MEISCGYGYTEIAKTCGFWWITCPICFAHTAIIIPVTGRIHSCYNCHVMFIESGIELADL